MGAGRRLRRSLLRAPTLAAAGLLTVFAVAVGMVLGALGGVRDPDAASSPAPTIEVAPGLEVPDVRGMSVPQARAVLERSGLRFERATAAEGTPGRVLETLPRVGRPVASGTAVTLIVGVEAERLVAGLVSSLSSEDSSASP